jgi:beta-galactosidase/beta-glucuronidase
VKFDPQYRDATLDVTAKVVFNGNPRSKVALQFALQDAKGNSVDLNRNTFEVPVNMTMNEVNCTLFVKSPGKWDPEHPNLYLLTTSLVSDGKILQTNNQKIGFRQIELRGNQFFVNNYPIKLRGVNRHEVHPLRGRSLTPALCRRDVELFRAGNCNYIRTSHYPPSEEFLQACDELGMFVESESSLCWIDHGASPIWKTWNYLSTEYLQYMVRANLENILSGRQHPSVIIWSLGNESRWSPLWERVLTEDKKLDPSRPTAFHDQCWETITMQKAVPMWQTITIRA